MKKLFTLVCTLALGCVMGFAQASTPTPSSDTQAASSSSTAKTKKAKKTKKSKKKSSENSSSTPEATPSPK